MRVFLNNSDCIRAPRSTRGRVRPVMAPLVTARPRQPRVSSKRIAFRTGRTQAPDGVFYLKDNRLLPKGFDKTTAASEIAVHGDALDDPDFSAAGDVITSNYMRHQRPTASPLSCGMSPSATDGPTTSITTTRLNHANSVNSTTPCQRLPLRRSPVRLLRGQRHPPVVEHGFGYLRV